MAKMKEILKTTDVIQSCTKERSNTRWRFFILTNLTIFAALLRDIPMGCKDGILRESLLKKHTVNCLTYEQNTKKPYKDNLCLFRSLSLHLHGNERLEEETSKLFNLFLVNSTNPDPSKFEGVCMDWYSICGRYSGYQYFHIRHRPYWRRNGWGTCTTKYQKVREECSVDTI